MERIRIDEVVSCIRDRVPCTDFLAKSPKTKTKNYYNCIYCNSGNGQHGTGAMEYYPESNTVYCHACENRDNGGPGKPADPIDVYQRVRGTDWNTAFWDLGERAGAFTNDERRAHEAQNATGRPEDQKANNSTPAPSSAPTGDTAKPEAQNVAGRYKELCERCAEAVSKTDYFTKRGLSPETVKKYRLGYDESRKAIVIPYSASFSYYTTRSINEKQFRKPTTDEAGPEPVYNAAALYNGEPCFVCEGPIDALSIIEAGGNACATSGTGFEKLIKQLKTRSAEAPLILCYDHDQPDKNGNRPGQEGQAKLAAELDAMAVPYIEAEFAWQKYGRPVKDPNDLLLADREQLQADIDRNIIGAEERRRPDSAAAYLAHDFAGDLASFRSDVRTGFTNLDEMAGGLYPGLYVVAATSSLGKTTFCVQMADQIAAAGTDVLYFSLEQSRFEIVTKSLARIMAADALKEENDLSLYPTETQIRKGQQPWLTEGAVNAYRNTVGDRMSIIEGNFNCNLTYITEYTKKYMLMNKTRPVVFCDYLQIMQPEEDDHGRRPPLREAIDGMVTGLKRFSRDNNLTVILISSVNRTNYLTPIDFESLKESGGIEYGADVVWGMQLAAITDNAKFSDAKATAAEKRAIVEKQMNAEPRHVELKCLKNRFGKSKGACRFDYYGAHALFVPQNEWQEMLNRQAKQKGRKKDSDVI